MFGLKKPNTCVVISNKNINTTCNFSFQMPAAISHFMSRVAAFISFYSVPSFILLSFVSSDERPNCWVSIICTLFHEWISRNSFLNSGLRANGGREMHERSLDLNT